MSFISKLRSQSYHNRTYHGITSKKPKKRITQYTINQVLDQLKNTQDSSLNNNLWILGFEKLKLCIYDYFQDVETWSKQDIENDEIQIEVFEFAYLDNEDHKIIIRASPNYYGQAVFSDVCVEMDESEQDDYSTDNGLCYVKVRIYKQI